MNDPWSRPLFGTYCHLIVTDLGYSKSGRYDGRDRRRRRNGERWGEGDWDDQDSRFEEDLPRVSNPCGLSLPFFNASRPPRRQQSVVRLGS